MTARWGNRQKMRAFALRSRAAALTAAAFLFSLLASCSLFQKTPAPIVSGNGGNLGYEDYGYGGYGPAPGLGANAYGPAPSDPYGYASGAGSATFSPDPGPAWGANGGADAPVMTAAAENGYYTVQRGDNLYRISLRFGVSRRQLVEWNRLANEDTISAGQRLRVEPPQGASRPGANRPKATTVAQSAPEPEEKKPAPAARPSGSLSLAWPISGKITRRYSNESPNIEITPASTATVRAAEAGVVSYIDKIQTFGMTIIVDHGDGLLTSYSNVEGIRVKNNQRVSKGQALASVSPSKPLTFTVAKDSVIVDPQKRLPKR